MSNRLALVALCTATALSASACGMASRMSSARMEAMPAAAMSPPQPQPLQQSEFARDPQGQLSEEKLQKILDAPLELDLPARAGVLPIIRAQDWRGPGPDYDKIPSGTTEFTKSLRGGDHFTVVTEVMPIPSGALGMEALREVAARYRLRYLILYREELRDETRMNPAAALYVTLVGALFIPGSTLDVGGYMEASLFDVKTGLLLVTVRRSLRAQKSSNVWYQDHKISDLKSALAQKFAPDLAKDLRSDMFRFAEAVKVENDRRGLTRPQPSSGTAAAAPN
jgi:rhombotail lipoprotein